MPQIPVVCSYCNETFDGDEIFYTYGGQWQQFIMCESCHDKSILEYHKTHGYSETAQKFKITIAELRAKIDIYNKTIEDNTFQHCDHKFTYFETLHKHAISYNAICSVCNLSTTTRGSRVSLFQDHPNATIITDIIVDCDDPNCPYCK